MEQIRARVPICLELKDDERMAGCQGGLPDELLHTALRVDVLLSQRLQCVARKEGVGQCLCGCLAWLLGCLAWLCGLAAAVHCGGCAYRSP